MNILSGSDPRSFLQGNIRVLATRSVLLTISGGLTGGLSALYVKTVLGADAVILGLFASIWSTVLLLFILIGGWISDRYDRKKTLLLGTAVTLPNPIIYALAPTWHMLLVANFLGALGSALANPAYMAMLVTSVEQRKRSRGIAVVNTLTSLANMVTPPLGAFVIQWMGGLEEMRIMFLLQFILASGVWVYTYKALQAMPMRAEKEAKGFHAIIKDISRQMREVYRLSKERRATPWLYIYLTGPLAWEMVGPFWTIYAAEVCGSSLFVIGLLATVYSLTSILLQIPVASVSDKAGRKKVMLAVRPFHYLCFAFLLLGGTYINPVLTPLIPLLAWTFRGVANSASPSWTAASTEVMPDELQGRWDALRKFLWYIMAIPASLVGGLLWNIDPRLPFIVALAVDGLIRYPILIYQIPETLIQWPSRSREVGPHLVIYGLSESGQTYTAQLVREKTKAEIIDESLMEERMLEKQIDEILSHEKETVIIEGKPAVFAANEPGKSTIVLLVAPKEERVRRRARRSKKPKFVALMEVEDEDREIARLTRRLYGADVSKLPPFDVAINTERVSPEKVEKIIAIVREEKKEEKNPN